MGEVDIGLRMVSQMLPQQLAAPFVGPHVRITRGELPAALTKETQLSRRELRLDKVLAVEVDGAPCLLHVEFQTALDSQQALRVQEYATALQMAAVLARGPRLPVLSVVVLLDGAQDHEPGFVHEWLGWPVHGEAAQRATFWLEPVYRYRLAELMARPVLWWVFAPLARDLDEAGFDALLRELCARVDDVKVRAEVGATMRVIAERRPQGARLGERIAAILGEEVLMQSEFLRSIEEKSALTARRAELLKFAARLVDADRLEVLRDLEDIDELEREVMAVLGEGRRSELLKVATRLANAERLAELCTLQDVDELECVVMALLDARLGPSRGDEDS